MRPRVFETISFRRLGRLAVDSDRALQPGALLDKTADRARRALLQRPPPFFQQAERTLADYQQRRQQSELGRVLAVARQLREATDRVVVLSSVRFSLAPQALFAACCHPYHNLLSRGDRGSRPRVEFASHPLDNDSMQGLLDLLGSHRAARSIEERWGLIVIDAPRDAEEHAAAEIGRAVLTRALAQSVGADRDELARRIVPIYAPIESTDRAIPPSWVAQAQIPAAQQFALPPSVDALEAAWTPAGLLPAAVMGMNVIQLLEGASALHAQFASAPRGQNPPLDFAAECSQPEHGRQSGQRVLCSWNEGLAPSLRWYERLLDERLRPAVWHRSPHAAGAFSVFVSVRAVRRDRLQVAPIDSRTPPSEEAESTATLPAFARRQQDRARADAVQSGGRALEFELPRLDEPALGQWLQLLMVATALEQELRRGEP